AAFRHRATSNDHRMGFVIEKRMERELIREIKICEVIEPDLDYIGDRRCPHHCGAGGIDGFLGYYGAESGNILSHSNVERSRMVQREPTTEACRRGSPSVAV